jgi:D-alanyl-D-alanine carboxypeptidase/D-alanyl-D-alanine-endopeptidase (penicillin-binding protein 4)
MSVLLRALCCALALAGQSTWAQGLPAEVESALARAKVPREALSVLVLPAQGGAASRLSHRAAVPVNAASMMKLLTTYAALDLLGPAFTWRTPVLLDGSVQDGTLQGNLYIQGQGDPKLVVERLWLLLRRVQGLGIRTITGDIVLDRSAFETVPQDPAEFDGEPLRPYNAAPDALLLNYKSVLMTFVPDATAKLARVQFEPPLAGVQTQASVPLSGGDCSDYRAALRAEFSDPLRIRFAGHYPASCGEKVWPVAYADPSSYAARAVEGLWREIGGKIGGRVREGKAPAGLKPSFEMTSAPLAEIVRDINKYSNNVMAQQLFLTLALQAGSRPDAASGVGTIAGARSVLQAWWKERIAGDTGAAPGDPVADMPVLDNGAGLSRQGRISAQALARLLQTAWRSPLMPELMSSLPISGVDGTLRRSKSKMIGSAHLKTGSLRDVSGVAGYVDGASGQRYVLVAIVNHPNALAARTAIDALIDWTAKDHDSRL